VARGYAVARRVEGFHEFLGGDWAVEGGVHSGAEVGICNMVRETMPYVVADVGRDIGGMRMRVEYSVEVVAVGHEGVPVEVWKLRGKCAEFRVRLEMLCHGVREGGVHCLRIGDAGAVGSLEVADVVVVVLLLKDGVYDSLEFPRFTEVLSVAGGFRYGFPEFLALFALEAGAEAADGLVDFWDKEW
jgi:hypothetical protein